MTHRTDFEEIHDQLTALLEKIEAPNYCEVTPRKDFQRDIAAALELGQKKHDLLAEILENEAYSDLQYFKEYSKKFDEVTERHGKQ